MALLVVTIIYPFLSRYRQKGSARMHPTRRIGQPGSAEVQRSSLALDFAPSSMKRSLRNALAQGQPDTEYVMIHIVESASARYFGKDADDFETRKDQEQLDTYLSF